MPAYVILDVSIHDPEAYEAYKKVSGPALAACGGRFLARGARTETLEGDWDPERLIILEFDSMEQARAWHDSDVYREPKKIRLGASTGRMILVDGGAPGAPA
ncbi:DUF1330 domain-containing protein [bacterium]|nr:DUF1330 domain-containing protein [bacterium]